MNRDINWSALGQHPFQTQLVFLVPKPDMGLYIGPGPDCRHDAMPQYVIIDLLYLLYRMMLILYIFNTFMKTACAMIYIYIYIVFLYNKYYYT